MSPDPSVSPGCQRDVTGVVLAGGRARRMGGEDKGLIELAGRRMVEFVVDALRPQVGALLINANRNPEHYRKLTGLDVLAEAYLDGAWYVVDATGMADPAQTVKIGVGRDAADVSFLTAFGTSEFHGATVSAHPA